MGNVKNTCLIKAAIFDLDGVIINSNPEIERFWQEWANKAGITISQDNIKQHIHGRKGVETIAALFNHLSNELKKEIMETAIVFDALMEPESIAGVVAFIQKLKADNIVVGLVTSSHKPRAINMLKKHGLENSFHAFVTAEDVQKGKPDPEPYLKMSEKLKIDVCDCLVFEDAISGVISATTARMKVVGINSKAAAKDLLRSGATTVIENFEFLNRVGNYYTPKDCDVQYQFVTD